MLPQFPLVPVIKCSLFRLLICVGVMLLLLMMQLVPDVTLTVLSLIVLCFIEIITFYSPISVFM